jgi:hypothetical protein
VLPGLLAAATLLFAVGVIAERSVADQHAEPAVKAEASEAGRAEQEGEAGEAAHTDEAPANPPGESSESGSERVLGVDAESTPLLVLAVLAGLALSVAAASQLGRRRHFLLAVVVIAGAWAAVDVREVLHQIDESRAAIAAVAIAVAVLHLLAGAVAGRRAAHAPAASA